MLVIYRLEITPAFVKPQLTAASRDVRLEQCSLLCGRDYDAHTIVLYIELFSGSVMYSPFIRIVESLLVSLDNFDD